MTVTFLYARFVLLHVDYIACHQTQVQVWIVSYLSLFFFDLANLLWDRPQISLRILRHIFPQIFSFVSPVFQPPPLQKIHPQIHVHW